MAQLLHPALDAAKVAGWALLIGLGYLLVIAFAVAIVAAIQRGLLPARLGPPKAPGHRSSSRLSSSEASEDARRIWRKMRRRSLPTLLAAPTKETRFSKMGGEPCLPICVAWPSGSHGPLAFLLQLNLAEVHASGGPDWLPGHGAIYAFSDELSDAPDMVQIIFAAEPGSLCVPPPDCLAAKRRYAERRITFLQFRSLPSLDWLEEDIREIDVDEDELDALADAPDEPFGDELQHRIGGYPSEIQDGQMAIAAEYASRGQPLDHRQPTPEDIAHAAKDWRLLLQIDSDPPLKMNWCDGGRLYVFIREADARASDFSKTVTIWQTH